MKKIFMFIILLLISITGVNSVLNLATNTPTTTSITLDSATKFGGGDVWGNSQAYSTNSYTGGAYLEGTFISTTNNWMISLNQDPLTDAHFTSLDYAIYAPTNIIQIYESGTFIGQYGNYNGADVFSIEYINSTIVYAKNGIPFLTRTGIGIGKTFYFDSSSFTQARTINNLKFRATKIILTNPKIEFQNITLNNISNFNNSYYNTTSQLLEVTLNTTDTNNNTNVTLYLYNSTNDLITTNQFITNNLTGSYNINFPYEDTFKFYMYAFNNETNVTNGNYTLTYDITKPNISLTFPSEINLNNQSINFSEFINVTEINNDTCSVSVTEFGQATQSFSNCFNTTFIFSNLGNASINVTATDLVGNSNSEIGIININLYRINMSFTSGFSGLLLDQVSVNETTLGNLGSSGNNSYLIVYLNPNNYTFISSKTSYQPSTTNFTKSNISISENLPIILSATFSFTLEDERTLGPWNITPTTSVLLQVICTNQSVIQQSVNSTNFTIDVPCAINKFKFIINYPTDSYFRSILIDETQIQRDVYLIDLSTTTPVFNTFTIFDLSNNFINPRLSFRKFIPGQGDTEITGDFVNAQGLVPAYFILNDEYTIQLTSDNQPTRVIGFYSADAPGNQVLKLFSLDFTKSSTNIIGKVFSNMYISNSTVYGLYDDLTLATSTATFTVYNQTQFGNILFTSTILNANNASFSYNIPTILENTTLFTRMSVTNNIDTFVTDKILRQNNQLSLGLINFNIDLNWTITIFLAFLGLVLTISTASVGALFIVGLGGLFSSFGWYSVGWPIIALGALLAIVKITKEGEDIK